MLCLCTCHGFSCGSAPGACTGPPRASLRRPPRQATRSVPPRGLAAAEARAWACLTLTVTLTLTLTLTP